MARLNASLTLLVLIGCTYFQRTESICGLIRRIHDYKCGTFCTDLQPWNTFINNLCYEWCPEMFTTAPPARAITPKLTTRTRTTTSPKPIKQQTTKTTTPKSATTTYLRTKPTRGSMKRTYDYKCAAFCKNLHPSCILRKNLCLKRCPEMFTTAPPARAITPKLTTETTKTTSPKPIKQQTTKTTTPKSATTTYLSTKRTPDSIRRIHDYKCAALCKNLHPSYNLRKNLCLKWCPEMFTTAPPARAITQKLTTTTTTTTPKPSTTTTTTTTPKPTTMAPTTTTTTTPKPTTMAPTTTTTTPKPSTTTTTTTTPKPTTMAPTTTTTTRKPTTMAPTTRASIQSTTDIDSYEEFSGEVISY